MQNLNPGRYMTKNSRIVELQGSAQEQTKKRLDGSTAPVKVWKGVLYRADGRTVESAHEWEETLLPNTIAAFVSAGRTEGVSSEFDLIQGPL
jgi:hypothetical protein